MKFGMSTGRPPISLGYSFVDSCLPGARSKYNQIASATGREPEITLRPETPPRPMRTPVPPPTQDKSRSESRADYNGARVHARQTTPVPGRPAPEAFQT